jgi:uncharacterized membrane protein YfcA
MTFFGTITAANVALSLMAAAVFLLAGWVKGVVGLGLPTISMALLALIMTPAEAAALLIVPSLVTNVWQIRPWRTLGPLLRRLGPMQVGVCAGTLAGAWALGAPAGAWAVVSLGAALIVYAVWGIVGAKIFINPATESWLGSVVGAATGLVTAATGVFVIPAVPYLQALGLNRDELIQAMGMSFTVSTLALAVGLYLNGQYSGTALSTSVVMLLPAIGGMYAGEVVRQRLSPTLFRRVFFGGLIVLGVYMIAREVIAHTSLPS